MTEARGPTESGHFGGDEVVGVEHFAQTGGAEDDDEGHVEERAESDGGQRAVGNVARRILQIAAHVDAGHDARHRRKVHAEHGEEVVGLVERRARIVGHDGHVPADEAGLCIVNRKRARSSMTLSSSTLEGFPTMLKVFWDGIDP